MLARGAAAKVAAGDDEDLGIAVASLVENEVGVLGASLAVVADRAKEVHSETSALDCSRGSAYEEGGTEEKRTHSS